MQTKCYFDLKLHINQILPHIIPPKLLKPTINHYINQCKANLAMRDERTKLLTLVIIWMDEGLQILTNLGQILWWTREEEEKNKREGEGKGGRTECGWTKDLYRTTFSTGKCHEPVQKVVVHKPFVHPSSSVLPLSPHFLCSSPLFLKLIINFAQSLSRFEGPHPFKWSQRLATLSFHLSLLD